MMRHLLPLLLCLGVSAQSVKLTGSFFWGQVITPAGTSPTIWYRPDDISSANTVSLGLWPDHSGNGYNGSALLPWTNHVIGPLGVAYGSSSYVTMTNAGSVSANIAGASCFAVIRMDTLTGLDSVVAFYRGGTASQRFFFRTSAGGLLDWEGATLDADTIRTIGPVADNPVGFFLVEAVVQYSAGKASMWTNGVLVGSIANLTAANTSNTASSQNPNWLRFDQSGGLGDGSEFLFYTNAVSDATRTNIIEPYFRNKYRLW